MIEINSSTNVYFTETVVSKSPKTPNKTELEMFGLDPGSTKTFLIHWILCMSHDLPETAMYSFGAN